MRILFLSHYFPPEVNAPATRTYEHCKRWAATGHDVTVVTCNPNCPDGVLFEGYRNRLRRQTETVDGIRVVRVWTYLAPNAGTLKRIINYVSYMLSATWTCFWMRRADVVVATSPQFFCGWAGVLVSKLTFRPLVLEIRDIWPESIEAVGAMSNRRLLRLLEVMEQWMYRAADHVVPVGEGYRENIQSKVDISDRSTVITNGVDVAEFDGAAADESLDYRWGLSGRFTCCYIGTIGMAHGLDVVNRAAKLLKDQGREDICFCIVGDGARRAELEQQARELGVEQLVKFPGRIAKEAVPAVLQRADACLVHLRKTDLFTTVIPSKIFETMAMSCPIIMGVQGESREIVERAQAAINMEPDSAEDLAAAVIKLKDDPELCKQLGRNGREFVAENYDRNRLAEEYLQLLIKVVES